MSVRSLARKLLPLFAASLAMFVGAAAVLTTFGVEFAARIGLYAGFACIVLFFLALVELSGKQRDAFAYSTETKEGREFVVDSRASLVAKLRHRAHRSLLTAYLFLLVLMVVIATAVTIYVRAREVSGVISADNTSPAIVNAVDLLRQKNVLAEQVQTAKTIVEVARLVVNEGDKDRAFIREMATRAGSIIILVFLAQFLISSYRYAIRVAAGYDACADALELKDKGWEAEVARTFTSIDVSFERVRSPTAELSELMKTLTGVVKEKTTGQAMLPPPPANTQTEKKTG